MILRPSIALWILSATQDREVITALMRLLSEHERERAARFRFPYLADRFVVGRGVLRMLLGDILEMRPEAVPIVDGPGKPHVRDQSVPFNLSHSGDLLAYALGGDAELGIDIEITRPIAELEGIARTHFAPPEYAELMSLDPSLRTDAFFRCWTRKEAYVKATGSGLMAPLHEFEVSIAVGDPMIRRIRGSSSAASEWTLHHLEPAPGCVGALAVHSRSLTILPWQAVDVMTLLQAV